jgi:hypothetical protein
LNGHVLLFQTYGRAARRTAEPTEGEQVETEWDDESEAEETVSLDVLQGGFVDEKFLGADAAFSRHAPE